MFFSVARLKYNEFSKKTSTIRGGIGSSDAQQLVIFFNFPKFFGHQGAKIDPFFPKTKSGLALTPRNKNPKLQNDWLKNFDFIEQKPHFWPILLSFLATRKPKIGHFI